MELTRAVPSSSVSAAWLPAAWRVSVSSPTELKRLLLRLRPPSKVPSEHLKHRK